MSDRGGKYSNLLYVELSAVANNEYFFLFLIRVFLPNIDIHEPFYNQVKKLRGVGSFSELFSFFR